MKEGAQQLHLRVIGGDDRYFLGGEIGVLEKRVDVSFDDESLPFIGTGGGEEGAGADRFFGGGRGREGGRGVEWRGADSSIRCVGGAGAVEAF